MTQIIFKGITKEALKRGEYQRTEIDDFRESADIHNRGWLSTRAEIYINKPERVNIKTGRGIEQCKDNPLVYFVTERVLKNLEQRYTVAPDW